MAWSLLFFLAPFLIALKISVAEYRLGVPPYTPLLRWVEGASLDIRLSFSGYWRLLEDPLYLAACLASLKAALISTALTLLLGYPMAHGIARSAKTVRSVLLLMAIVPFWTSFLVRVYAWIAILGKTGLLNTALMALGAIDRPLRILNTDAAVYIAMVYSYLPFMILPLYATLEKMDWSLVEAALDLGCPPWKAFLRITLPLSAPGVVAGCMLVFIPMVGEFVIPDLLGGADTLMIGKVLWQEFFRNRDWPAASAVAVVMLALLVGPIMIFQHYRAVGEDRAREGRA